MTTRLDPGVPISRRGAMAVMAGGALALASRSRAQRGADTVVRRRLGGTDMTVSVVGFGGLTIGLSSSPQERVTALLNQALDNGLNFIDTAECYGRPGENHSESLIGEAIGRRRDEYYLCSKVGHEHGAFAQGHQDWSAPSILRTIERSLKRLRTDRLDVVYLHGCSVETIRDGEAIEALRQAREQGKIRYLGYSGDGERLATALATGAFDVVQMSFNVFEQDPIDGNLAEARRRGLGAVIKRPLGNAVWRYDERPEWWYYHEYWDLMQALEYDFFEPPRVDDPGPRGAGGMALRFVASTPGVHCAIVGTQSVGRWSQNNGNVAAGPLPREEWRAIHTRWKQVTGR